MTTKTYLRENGIEPITIRSSEDHHHPQQRGPSPSAAARTITIRSSELGRGRGGPRCMTWPMERDA